MPVSETHKHIDNVFDAFWNKFVKPIPDMLPNIFAAAIILLISWLIARFARRMLYKVLLKKDAPAPLTKLLINFAVGAFILMGFLFALEVMKLDKIVTTLLAGAGFLGLALSLAFQSYTTNLISGFFILWRKPYKVGDTIKTKDYHGEVKEINLKNTLLHNFDGQLIVIPSKDLFQVAMTNYNMTGSARIVIRTGVSYSADLEFVRKVAIETISGLEFVDKNRPVTFFYEKFSAFSIDFALNFWIASDIQADYMNARSEAIIAIKQAFDNNGIVIPFPVTTIENMK